MAGLWAALLAGCPHLSRRPQEVPLTLKKADDAFRLGDLDRAARAYRIYLEENPSDEAAATAWYRLARIEAERGRYREALKTLDELERHFPEGRWPAADFLRGRAYWGLGYRIAALQSWERARSQASGKLRSQIDREIRSRIPALSAGERQKALELIHSSTIRDWLRSAPAGPVEPPRTQPARHPDTEWFDFGEPSAAAGTGATAGLKVAVLLPLSGRYAGHGRKTLDGVRLALAEAGLRWLTRDTAGDPRQARKHLDALAADPTVVAVIGPLRGRVAEAVAPYAERQGLPLLVLAFRSVPTGRFVLQPSMTEKDQAEALVSYARQHLKALRFAVLYPANRYGQVFAGAFADAVGSQGGVLVGASSYLPETTDVVAGTSATLAEWVSTNRIDALFLPDAADRALELAAEARRLRPDIGILGSAAWRTAALAEAPPELDGAVFADGFFAYSARPATRAFVARFRQTYERDPDLLEAQGYDAGALIASALAPGVGRTELVRRILESPLFEGAAGDIVVRDGKLERRPFVLELAQGQLRETGTGAGVSTVAPRLSGHWKTSLEELEGAPGEDLDIPGSPTAP